MGVLHGKLEEDAIGWENCVSSSSCQVKNADPELSDGVIVEIS